MPTFGALLETSGLSPGSVRLLRHRSRRHAGGPTPHALWRDDRSRFEAYQETQEIRDAPRLRAPWWAVFLGVTGPDTLFAGLYAAEYLGRLPADRPHPVTGGMLAAGSCDLYRLVLSPLLHDHAGSLRIAWGPGYRAWIQRGAGRPKPIAAL